MNVWLKHMKVIFAYHLKSASNAAGENKVQLSLLVYGHGTQYSVTKKAFQLSARSIRRKICFGSAVKSDFSCIHAFLIKKNGRSDQTKYFTMLMYLPLILSTGHSTFSTTPTLSTFLRPHTFVHWKKVYKYFPPKIDTFFPSHAAWTDPIVIINGLASLAWAHRSIFDI